MPRFMPFLVVLAMSTCARVAAQPTFTRIVVQDHVSLDLPPRDPGLAADGDVFVTRSWLAPAGRQRLAAGLGHRFVTAVDPAEPGAAVFSTQRLSGIPGDRRLRVELVDGTGLQVLGRGASVEESLAAATSEPMPSALLIGADPDAVPPERWARIGEPLARPVIWGRSVSVHGDSSGGARREFAIQDGYGGGPGPVGLKPFLDSFQALRGPYPLHLQGIAIDPELGVYWSWTDRIVKTDAHGDVVREVAAPPHHGDLCWHDGRVVVAVNHGEFNDPDEAHDSWAYVYDADTLELVEKHRLPEARFGAGGVCWAEDRYVVVGGLPAGLEREADAANEVHEYDADFRHLRTVRLPGGWTRLGIQTAEFAYGRLFFGCYGEPRCALIASPDLRHVRRCDGVDCAYGIAKGPGSWLIIAYEPRGEDGHRARLSPTMLSRFWR